MRARMGINLKDRKTLVLDDLKGVDFSTSPFEVSPNRATDMRNLINRYGTNCKRNGWRELFSTESDKRETRRINGFWKYGNHFLLHAGARFYRVDVADGEYSLRDITESSTHAPSLVDAGRLRDDRSEAYLRNERLYIVGAGDYLVYGTWNGGESYELRRVENGEDTYIPTTTININCDAESESDVKGVLDEPNLLCKKRINRLVGTDKDEATWTLDSPIEEGSEVKVRVEFYDVNGEVAEKVYINGYTRKGTVIDGGKLPDEVIPDEVVTGSDTLYRYMSEPYEYGEEVETGGSVNFEEGKITLSFATPTVSNTDNIYVTFVSARREKRERVEVFTGEGHKDITVKLDLQPKEGETIRVNIKYYNSGTIDYINEYTNSLGETYGRGGCYLYRDETYHKAINPDNPPSLAATVNFETGEIAFNIDTQNYRYSTKLENNITITYVPSGQDEEHGVEDKKEAEMNADDINGCSFGMLFGAYGNTDRLFVTGNDLRPNVDYYSASDDFTYFTSGQTAALGSDSSPIGGYARLSDSTMVIYKKAADREATIYYRTGSVREYYDGEGKLCEGETVFPVTAGAIGETLISRSACVNFAGDNIMLSRNGVFGVVLGQNLVAAERYTRERSRSVNERLCAHANLSEAVGVVFENRYYLSVDGVCYIADARYKYRASDDADGSYNYEWWYWDNLPARIWAVIDGKLYFGTDDGKICVFDSEYTDRTLFKCYPGELGFNSSDGTVTFSEAVRAGIYEGKHFEFTSPDVYSLYLDTDGLEVREGRIYVPQSVIFGIYDGTELYVDRAGDSGLIEGGTYKIYNTDIGDGCFELLDGNGEAVSVLCSGFRLHRAMRGRRLFVTEISDNSFKLKDYATGEYIAVSDFGDKLPSAVSAQLIDARDIIAEWYSPIFDLGTNMASKTILGLTVACDNRFEGRLKVGYRTRFSDRELTACVNRRFAFDNFSFDNMSFDTGFAVSHTFRLNQRNVNYIVLRCVSEGDGGCALQSLSLLYKINKNNRGIT